MNSIISPILLIIKIEAHSNLSEITQVVLETECILKPVLIKINSSQLRDELHDPF